MAEHARARQRPSTEGAKHTSKQTLKAKIWKIFSNMATILAAILFFVQILFLLQF